MQGRQVLEAKLLPQDPPRPLVLTTNLEVVRGDSLACWGMESQLELLPKRTKGTFMVRGPLSRTVYVDLVHDGQVKDILVICLSLLLSGVDFK